MKTSLVRIVCRCCFLGEFSHEEVGLVLWLAAEEGCDGKKSVFVLDRHVLP